jgi:hypothetical protein
MAKAATKPQGPPPDVVEHIEVEQGSEAWFAARVGLATASNFSVICAEGRDGEASKTRTKMLYRLAGEILTGQPAAETFKSKAMERGNEMEPHMRELYENKNPFVEIKRVGFFKRTITTPTGTLVVGASPDLQVGPSKGAEIKTMQPDLLIAQALRGTPPGEHRAQVQGTMWVCGWTEMDLFIGYRGMPIQLTYKFTRDEAYIAELRREVERFDWDLNQIVKKIRAMGGAR